MKKLASMLLALSLITPAVAMAANGKQNYLGVGMGVASVGDVSDSGYTFLFQMQQGPTAAIGFAYQDADKITFTYKAYTGKYASTPFIEGGMLLNTANDAVAPVIGVGGDLPLQGDLRLSATAGIAFDSSTTAFVGRVALLFRM
jgi:hypothetical protein